MTCRVAQTHFTELGQSILSVMACRHVIQVVVDYNIMIYKINKTDLDPNDVTGRSGPLS